MGLFVIRHHLRAVVFQSTHPVWDGTLLMEFTTEGGGDFNPPIPCGMGRRHRPQRRQSADFNPPIPCGMGLIAAIDSAASAAFQSTHPVWDGTWPDDFRGGIEHISIHPSRVGWDMVTGSTAGARPISIHPSRVGWDFRQDYSSLRFSYFNPPIPCGMGLFMTAFAA